MIRIEKAVVGAFEVNCFVIWGTGPGAIVVDPGGDADAIRGILSRNDLPVAVYLLTHGHIDHLSALDELRATHPAPIGIHPADAAWAFSETNNFPPFYIAPRKPATIERILAEGRQWTDSGLTYKVIGTPGHTPGGVCFYFESDHVLVTGDTLFRASVGRTDLPGGDESALARSLRKLSGLPDNTRICAGHGPDSTLADEKQSNYFMQSACQP